MVISERRDRIRQVRRQLGRDGPPWSRDRGGDFAAVTVPEGDCDLLRDLLIAEAAETVIEVGLADAALPGVPPSRPLIRAVL